MSRKALCVEFLLVFVAAPLCVAVVRQRLFMALVLWASALGAWLVLRQMTRQTELQEEAPEPCGQPCTQDGRQALRCIALGFAALAPLLCLGAWLHAPERFLALPLEHPWRWLAVMLGYPLLSVWPQEVLFRRFALVRYAPLFGTGPGFVAASGLAFGFAHVIFLNLVAVALSTLGGFLFSANYARHRSLPLVCLEHALYGCLIFSIGLGRFFFSGAAWQ